MSEEDMRRKLENAKKNIELASEIMKFSRLMGRATLGFGEPWRDKIFARQGEFMKNLKQRFNPPKQRVPERFSPHRIQPHQVPQQQIQQNFPRIETPIRKGFGEMLSRVSVSEQKQYEPPPRPKQTESHIEEREETFMPELAVTVDNWKSYSVEQKRKKKMSEISIEE